jgi:hypothetical protein
MTLPNERYRSIENTRNFLQDLLDPKKTPRVPKEVRTRAYWCLRHYPWEMYMEETAKKVPTIWSKK